jgi:hypothetical protein
MKSFSQFLQESYLNEDEKKKRDLEAAAALAAATTPLAGSVALGNNDPLKRLDDRLDRDTYNSLPNRSKQRLGGPSALGRQRQPLRGSAGAPAIRSARARASANAAPEVSQTNKIASQTTQPEVSPQGKTTTVASPARKPSGAAADAWQQFPGNPPKKYGTPEPPSSRVPYGNRTLSGTPSRLALPASGSTSSRGRREFTPELEAAERRNRAAAKEARAAAYDAKQPAGKLATRGTNPQAPPEAMMRGAYDKASTPRTSSGGSGGKPPALPAVGQTGGKPPTGPKIKIPSGLKRAGRIGGKLLGPAAAALDVADERAKGSGWLRSGLKAAVVGGAGALGAAAGAPLTPVGSLAAGTGAAMAASKAFDVVAGANAVERKAMATANRQKQAGTAIKGIGGQTSFSQKKPGGPAFMSTGSGSQRKTVQLAKTGVVQRGGQSTAGHLAFKDGKAVYKAGPSAQSLAKTSSNPLERIGRTMFAGAYKKHDAVKAQQALQKARQNDAARNKKLGVKALPGK